MEHYDLLQQTKIFASASEFECQAMMFCFKTKFKTFEKFDKIVTQGEPMDYVILILKGSAKVENCDSLGDVTLLSQLNKGDVYGIESAYINDSEYQDSIIAKEKCLVLFMDKYRLMNMCDNKCKRHEFVIKHINQIIAESNTQLLKKITHISKKTIREKLMSYFASVAEASKSHYFDIPYNVTELSRYLSVDRSALSSELSKMRADGLIDYDKKHYQLKKTMFK